MNPATRRALDKIADGETFDFYQTQDWRTLSAYVRKHDRHECQRCKARGRYSRGEMVHHVKELRDRPDLALALYDKDTGERQLITLCKRCHEELHPQALTKAVKRANAAEYVERWD